MTATTTTDVPDGERATREPGARFRDLVAAEWLKHRSLRSTWIAYGATALAVIGCNAGTAYDTYSHWTLQVSKDRAAFEKDGIALQEAFTPNAALLMALAIGAIGALVIVGEYSTGTIRTTCAAVPARRSVMGGPRRSSSPWSRRSSAWSSPVSRSLRHRPFSIVGTRASPSATREPSVSFWPPPSSRRCARSPASRSAPSSGTPLPP
ncbi:hypothetical protein GCM10020295_26100 [Streptomyces cinereospinus]